MREISDQAGLEALVAGGGKVAVLYHARWCPFCRSFKPVFADAAGRLEGFEAVESLLDDTGNPLWTSEAIRVVPTIVFYSGGRAVGRLEAAAGIGLSAGQLESAWNAALRRA